ncbi:MAG: hypothetical protein AAFN77_15910 [Planctomycetota bacterium]
MIENLMENMTQFLNPETAVWLAGFATLTATVSSLLIAGRNGWAWPVLSFLGNTIRFLFRLAASMFRELASDYDGTGSWDDE